MRNIRQNLFFAFIYNAAGVPIAAGVLYPVLRHPALADHRGRRDGAVIGERHRKRCAVEGREAVDGAEPETRSGARPGIVRFRGSQNLHGSSRPKSGLEPFTARYPRRCPLQHPNEGSGREWFFQSLLPNSSQRERPG